MIPYFTVPDLLIGPLTLHGFGLLVVAAIVVGNKLGADRARHVGVSAKLIESVTPWLLVGGFIGAHPGIGASASNIFAVAYPLGPKYDLGYLEMLLALVLAGLFALTWRSRLPRGSYIVLIALLYAPARFGLAFLRASPEAGGDVRYLHLTPAQWGCIALFGFGLRMALRTWFVPRVPAFSRTLS